MESLHGFRGFSPGSVNCRGHMHDATRLALYLLAACQVVSVSWVLELASVACCYHQPLLYCTVVFFRLLYCRLH
jgi:hypothetical protein